MEWCALCAVNEYLCRDKIVNEDLKWEKQFSAVLHVAILQIGGW